MGENNYYIDYKPKPKYGSSRYKDRVSREFWSLALLIELIIAGTYQSDNNNNNNSNNNNNNNNNNNFLKN